jgi:excisionase family DNA binding protein
VSKKREGRDLQLWWRKAMKKKNGTQTLTAEELSRILGISGFTVKRLAREGELPCEYAGKQPRFNLKALMKYFRRLEGDAV